MILIEHAGETLTMRQHALRRGLPYHTVRSRMGRGLSIDAALASEDRRAFNGGRPAKAKPEPRPYRPLWTPDPLNAALRAWIATS